MTFQLANRAPVRSPVSSTGKRLPVQASVSPAGGVPIMPARARRSRLGTQAKIVSSRLAGETAACNNFRLRRGGGERRKAGSLTSPKRGEQLSPAERERQARLRRFTLQDHAARLLPLERVAACARRISDLAGSVEGRYNPQSHSAHYRGLQTCGSVWHCPICAAKISEQRREELSRLVKKHVDAGGSVWMTTYTVQHHTYTNLADLLKRFLEARRKMRQGRRGMALRKEFDIIGTVSVLEVTWSPRNGWHPHIHELVLSSLPGEQFPMQQYESIARAAWKDAAQAQGLAMNAHGFQMDQTFGAVQDYITKFGHEPTNKTPWGVEAEMTKAHIKQARSEAGMTPFALLGAIADGLEKYAPRWQEYASVFKGRKQLTYSPGLKERYQEEEKTDEELAAEGETTEAITLVDLSPDQWNVVVERRARGGLLELIRTGRIGEIIEGLAEIGVQVQPPEMRGWQVATPDGQGKALTVCFSRELRRWRCSVLLDRAGPDGYRYQIYDVSDITVVGAGVPVQACA
jgi:hypothetical protein